MPAGQPELNATITVQDPGDQFGAYLIDPQGEAVADATNMAPGATLSSPPDDQVGAQLHTLNPGDPTRMVARMIDSVDHDPAPRRIVLGSDSFGIIRRALAQRLADVESQEENAAKTDADDATATATAFPGAEEAR